MEDRKLIRLIQRSPEKGISAALDLYGSSVKTICKGILAGQTEQDIEEAIAETFVRLWRYGKSFKAGDGTSLKSYIYSIARNASIDKLKAIHGEEVSMESIENFQLQDDLLDSYGDERLGKKIGGDILEGKKTYLMITAMSRATDEQREILRTTHLRNDISDEEKIACIKQLYDTLGVPAMTEQQIAVRIARATAVLDTLDIPTERTLVLKSYFEGLAGRNK
jgi:RNA polymerase sigma factor (sigma-70 family)